MSEDTVRSAVDRLVSERAKKDEETLIRALYDAAQAFGYALQGRGLRDADVVFVAGLIAGHAAASYGRRTSFASYSEAVDKDRREGTGATLALFHAAVVASATETVVRELRDSMRVAAELIERGDVEES